MAPIAIAAALNGPATHQIHRAAKDFGGDYGFLELASASLETSLHHKLEEAGHALIASETGAPEDSLKFLPDSSLLRSHRGHPFEDICCFPRSARVLTSEQGLA